MGAEGTILCPFEAKKSKNCFLISSDELLIITAKILNLMNDFGGFI
jgi:hypothetical protein